MPSWNCVLTKTATIFRCYRTFIVHANTILDVQCDVFDVIGGRNCKKDYVELMWGISGDHAQYCDEGGELMQVRVKSTARLMA